MKTVIEFLPDLRTGNKPVLDLIRNIKLEGKTDQNKLQMFILIIRGLEFLRRNGLQKAFKDYFITNREDGLPYTIKLVKRLKNHAPLMEFRVNWEDAGAFRAVFFEYETEDTQILAFATATIKQKTFDPAFESIAKKAERIYTDFISYPEKYMNETGGKQV